MWSVPVRSTLKPLLNQIILSAMKGEEECIVKVLPRGKSWQVGPWRSLVEPFVFATYNTTKVKYGTLSEKLFFEDRTVKIRKLDWTKFHSDFEFYCNLQGNFLNIYY